MRSRSLATRAAGFTLAEVVVAIVLLGCGGVALIGASAGALRAVHSAEVQERAVLAARDRVEQIASRACHTLRDGTAVDSTLTIREQWTIGPIRNGVRLVTDTVEYNDRGAHAFGLTRLVLC